MYLLLKILHIIYNDFVFLRTESLFKEKTALQSGIKEYQTSGAFGGYGPGPRGLLSSPGTITPDFATHFAAQNKHSR